MKSSTRIVKSVFSLALVLAIALSGRNVVKRSRLSASSSHVRISDSNLPASLSIANPAPLRSNPEKRKSTAPVEEAYGKLPLSFEVNHGQAESQVKYLSRGNGYALFLTSTEAVIQLPIGDCRLPNPSFVPPYQGGNSRGVSHRQSSTLRMQLVGANPNAKITGLDELPGKSNYFIGSDPKKWQTNIPTYAKVKYQNVYAGVDLIYYGNQRQLEYDFVVAPGGNLRTIRMSFQGQQKIEIDGEGELVLNTASGTIRQRKPLVYQEVNGVHHEVEGHYALKDQHQVGFQVGDYDPTRPLIIDPVLVYSTYLGGSGDENRPRNGFSGAAIAVDAEGNAYVTGNTDSIDFPVLSRQFSSPFQPSNGGSPDAFVAKLNPTGTTLLYSTYLGGSGIERGFGIAVDGAGKAFVAGRTQSPNFPTKNALQTSLLGFEDAFVVKLDSFGSGLLYSTYLGGSDGDDAHGIAVDSSGNAYVTGGTSSVDFPTVGPFQSSYGGGRVDAYVAKLNILGSALIYSTYLGGSGLDHSESIAIDSAGNAYVTGSTDSSDFPKVNPLQSTFGGVLDAFVAKFNPAGSALVYSTYLGGSDGDAGLGIAADLSGSAYVAGGTGSPDFPTAGPLQPAWGGNVDAFVTKVNPTGSLLMYSTYLGHGGEDIATSIAVDTAGNAFVTGTTTSSGFPILNALQTGMNGNRDAFVTKLNGTGTAIVYSTYLGGCDLDYGYGVAVDSAGNAYVTGRTFSPSFPTTTGALQPDFGGTADPSLGGTADAFVTKISESPPPDNVTLFVPIVLSSSGLNNSFFTSEMTVTNRGTKNATLQFTYKAAFGDGSGIASDVLPAGQQRILPDAIAYLRSIGIPIPGTGNRGGTLTVHFSGLAFPSDAAVTIRTTTGVAGGRAGLAYAGIPIAAGLTGPSYLCGLRQNSNDRSNVALQNVGGLSDGGIVLRLTVFSGDPATPFSQVLPDTAIPPGGFVQISGILSSNGLSLTNGYVRIERVSGMAPYYVYAVINDQANSDGSFIPPLRETELAGQARLALPVIVETSAFSSEVVLTNFSTEAKTLRLDFVSDAIQATGSTASIALSLNPGEQSIIPNFVQYLRDNGSPSVGPIGPSYTGTLFATVDGGAKGIFLGARTSTPGGGGRYGLFYMAPSACGSALPSLWLNGLQQNAESRTNLALINTGEGNESVVTFRIELFDGNTGLRVNSVEGITLNPRQWLQIGTILAKYAPGVTQGYARVTRTAGSNPFIAYAVINDGGQPGQRTGDGAYVVSSP